MPGKTFAGEPGRCLVCQMPLAGKKNVLTKMYHHDLYTFCCSECYQKFEESPETYLNGNSEEEE